MPRADRFLFLRVPDPASAARVRRSLPGSELAQGGLFVPLDDLGAEEVLAICLRDNCPIIASRVVAAPERGHSVDAAARAPLALAPQRLG